MRTTIHPLDLIQNHTNTAWDEIILDYIKTLHGTKTEITIDDEPIRDFLLNKMHHNYLMENDYEYCHIIEDENGNVNVVRGEDDEFVADAADCPDASDARYAWKSFIDRNSDYVFETEA